jgi:hypothetical protein
MQEVGTIRECGLGKGARFERVCIIDLMLPRIECVDEDVTAKRYATTRFIEGYKLREFRVQGPKES